MEGGLIRTKVQDSEVSLCGSACVNNTPLTRATTDNRKRRGNIPCLNQHPKDGIVWELPLQKQKLSTVGLRVRKSSSSSTCTKTAILSAKNIYHSILHAK